MFKHILVPTDGSKLSQKAVKEAIQLAKITHASIIALHVYPKFLGSPYGTYGPADEILAEAHENQARAAGDTLFEGIRKLTDGAGIALDTVLASSNEVWKQIIATGKKKKCDLICMASHGRHGVSAVLLGSETNKVLTHSDIPVLVLR